jgi:hypothetical protein
VAAGFQDPEITMRELMRGGFLTGVLLIVAASAHAQSPSEKTIPVTVDNFIRAESDMYFGKIAVKDGALGKFVHDRDVAQIDDQTVIRQNRDTLYSKAVFDLDAGPVKITLPKAGKRFMSMMALNEDHYIYEVDYGAGTYSFTKPEIGTRYVLIGLRTLVDPNDPKDMQQAHALQDAVKVQQSSAGRFAVPKWDSASQKKVRDALLALSSTLPDLRRAFGSRFAVDPVRHLIATASAWGGNPDKDALYLNVTPVKNDGATVYKLNVKNVPVDGFWSISVYNAEGYFQKNAYNAYTLNNITAKKSADGSVDVQFGGCDGKIANCLPAMNGWNYLVRLYRPRATILDGKWKFPEAKPAS